MATSYRRSLAHADALSDPDLAAVQLDLDVEQQTDSKLEKERIKAVYCHPAY